LRQTWRKKQLTRGQEHWLLKSGQIGESDCGCWGWEEIVGAGWGLVECVVCPVTGSYLLASVEDGPARKGQHCG